MGCFELEATLLYLLVWQPPFGPLTTESPRSPCFSASLGRAPPSTASVRMVSSCSSSTVYVRNFKRLDYPHRITSPQHHSDDKRLWKTYPGISCGNDAQDGAGANKSVPRINSTLLGAVNKRNMSTDQNTNTRTTRTPSAPAGGSAQQHTPAPPTTNTGRGVHTDDAPNVRSMQRHCPIWSI